MNGFRIMAGAATLALLGACTQPAPPPAVVVDPYAGSRYTGPLTQGALPGTPTAEDFRRTAGDTVLFPENDATLSGEARATLVRQADLLRRNGSFSKIGRAHV